MFNLTHWMISTQVFLSLISTAGRELAMLEDVAGIVEALQDVNVEIFAPSGYDPSTKTLGLGMARVDGLGLEVFRASVLLVAQGLDLCGDQISVAPRHRSPKLTG